MSGRETLLACARECEARAAACARAADKLEDTAAALRDLALGDEITDDLRDDLARQCAVALGWEVA